MKNKGLIKSMAKFLLAMFLILFFTQGTYAKFKFNYTDVVFPGQENNLIKMYIVEGAGYFLNSLSDFQRLLNRLELGELAPVDYSELRDIVNKTFRNMELAGDRYIDLSQQADIAPYDQLIIDRLKIFDFEDFQRQNALNRDIFALVVKFLSQGDVRGVYREALFNCQAILAILVSVKAAIEENNVPLLTDLWNLNDLYCRSLLFGQYVTEVFFSLSGNL